MKKRLLSVCSLLLSAALLLTGCWQDMPEENPEDLIVDDSAPAQEESSPVASTLPAEFSLPYDPDVTLDPLTCPDGPHLTIGALLYEGLFALDASFQPQPKLCADYSCDETKTVWTFRIRDDILFSDGTRLTAADAAASLNRARETERYRSRLADVVSITWTENAVAVTLSFPNAALPALLDIPIVKAGTEASAAPVGTGPYCLSVNEDAAALIPSDTWWSTDTLPVETIPLSECSGTAALHHQFSSRDIQLITADLTGQDAFRPTGSVRVWDADTTILQFIGFNTNSPLFSSAGLRNALGLGIDRATLVTTYLAGHAIAAQSPISPVSPLYPNVLDNAYSVSAFTEAMTAAGYNTGASREVTLLVNSENSFKVSAAQYLAGSLSACDIKLTVKALPWDEYTAALTAGEYDLYYGEVKLTADWDLSELVGSGGSMNYGGYSDLSVDYLLKAYASAADAGAAMRSLCRYLQAQAPILPLCFKRTSVLTEGGVADGLSPTAADPFYQLGSISIQLSKSE